MLHVRVDVHHHLVLDNARLDVILAKLIGLEGRLTAIQAVETQMAGELDALTAQVTANTDAEASAITLLNNLHALLLAAGTDPTKLAALAGTLKGSGDALAAAIVANTPAA